VNSSRRVRTATRSLGTNRKLHPLESDHHSSLKTNRLHNFSSGYNGLLNCSAVKTWHYSCSDSILDLGFASQLQPQAWKQVSWSLGQS